MIVCLCFSVIFSWANLGFVSWDVWEGWDRVSVYLVYLGKGVTGSQGYIIHIHKTCACTGHMCKGYVCVSVYHVYLGMGVTGYHLYLEWVGQSVCQNGSMFHVHQGWDRDYP